MNSENEPASAQGDSGLKEGVEQILGIAVCVAILFGAYHLSPTGMADGTKVLYGIGSFAAGIAGCAGTMLGLKTLWG